MKTNRFIFQLAKFATYGYFLIALIARQDIRDAMEADFYFPFKTTLEFFFLVGWYKVGETLL